ADRLRASDRANLEILGPGPLGVRHGFGVVRLAAMADRGALAFPDPRGDGQEIRLSDADQRHQTQDPWVERRQAFQVEGERAGFIGRPLQARAGEFPNHDSGCAQAAPGRRTWLSGLYGALAG